MKLETAFCVVLLYAVTTAQRTLVVDAANGPGTNFTDLSAALGQAVDGDVYLLRAGTYASASTSKGVSLLGITSGVVLGSFTLSGLPAGKSFAMSSLDVQITGNVFSGLVPGLTISACQGNVHLTSVAGRAYTPTPNIIVDIATITASSSVTILSSQFSTQVTCVNSNLVLVSSSGNGQSSAPLVYYQSSPALVLNGSQVHICGGSYLGGSGTLTCLVAPQPAITCSGGTLTLRSAGPGLRILAGGTGLSCSGKSALVIAGSSVSIDPSVTLQGSGSTPPISGTYTLLPLPGLTTTGGGLGGSVASTLQSPPNDSYVLFLGLPQVPVGYAFGSLFVDPSTFVAFAAGVQSVLGLSTISLPVPNDPALRGKGIAFQAVSQSLATSALQLSNPAVPVLF